jgi:hypothetical protein
LQQAGGVSRYGFVTQWRLGAPLEPVWDTIYDTDSWPEWWPGVRRVEELVARSPDGVGGVSRFTVRSVLPYDLVFVLRSVRVERHRLFEAVASGELEGVGRWRFFRDDGGSTTLFYQWDVGTTDPALDERARAAGASGLRVEPRSRHGGGRRGSCPAPRRAPPAAALSGKERGRAARLPRCACS